MNRIAKILGLLLLAAAVHADSVTTIELQSRPAEEVIPVVEPMLDANDAISGKGFTIFLRSSPETVARVREMIAVLDTPARILQVSVFQGDERDLGELDIGGYVEYEGGDVSAEVGDPETGDSAGSVTYSTSSGRVSVDGISTQQSLRNNPIHQIRVTEGAEAYIETGEEIPYLLGAWRGRRGVGGSVEYRTATTGFYVLPRLRGDNVVIEVNPYKSARADSGDDGFDTQSAATTVTGRLGEWILVGGVTEHSEQSQSTIGNRIETEGRRKTGVWIKADLAQ